jgi:hypothetical protein
VTIADDELEHIMKINLEGETFQLKLNADGLPYTLRRWSPTTGKSGRWVQVWADWHCGGPTGIRKRAIEKAGWVNAYKDSGDHRWKHKAVNA